MIAPDDIRDIRGPIPIPYWWMPLAIGLAAVALVAIAYGAYRLIRKRRRERARTPAELALERIEKARAILSGGTSAEFSAEVSDAVRSYIEARFGILAAHRTTEEFLYGLLDPRGLDTSAAPIARHRDALDDFLAWCDRAKFARLAFTPEKAASLADSASAFVAATADAPKVAREKKAKRLLFPPRATEARA